MIKFVKQKSRDNSTKDKCHLRKKSNSNDGNEGNDSGTESDGDIINVEKLKFFDLDMETSTSSCLDANSPTDTACSSESSAMMCQSHLLYDQHSSEEELEVINGPSSIAAAEAAGSTLVVRATTSSLISERGSSSLETGELFGEASTSKRCSSSFVENRKRSLAHSSDDEAPPLATPLNTSQYITLQFQRTHINVLRNLLEPILTPVNFRTSPPLEALKPNRSHLFRSTTPLILTETRCGIENIKICDNSVNENDENGDSNGGGIFLVEGSLEGSSGGGVSASKVCTASSLKMSNSSHHIYQPQPKYHFHYNSSRSSPASTTGLDADVRSVSPPAKLFHCAISPRRRPMRTHHAHAPQRLQRPHRPCLDFDKMQQVSL